MLKIFRLIFRTGRVTTGYPAVVEPPPPAFRGRPELRPVACDNSAECVAVCPSAALTLGAPAEHGLRVWELDLGRCVFCGLCRDACPNGAIDITPDFELAARQREDLYVRVMPAARTRAKGSTGR